MPPRGLVRLEDEDAPDFIEANRVVLLAFLDGADDICERLRVRLDAFAARHPEVAFGALDVRRSRMVAESLGVKSVPFLVVFREGEVVDRLIGGPPDAVIEDVLRMRGRG